MAVHRTSTQVGWLRFIALGLCSSALVLAGCEGSLPAVPPQPLPPDAQVAPSSCDDDNPCTDDIVDPDGTCSNVPRARGCDDGDPCTYDDRCDAAGKCGGTAISCTDETSTCGANRTCNGTSQCAESFPGSDTACTAEGITDAHCDGAGNCTGAAPPPTECVSDSCFKREIDAATGQCKIVERYGREVYERFDDGWAYAYTKEGSAKLAFRVVAEDLTLYLLHAPGIHEKMLSESPNEANNCHWCYCASACTFYGTSLTIHTSRTQLPGTVPLQRYVDGSVSHRESLRPIDGWYAEPQFHGFVCPLL